MIYRIDETTSTNDEARDAKYRHGDIVWAERQTAGRGQRGHTWTSPEGENLTFSMVLEPRFLPGRGAVPALRSRDAGPDGHLRRLRHRHPHQVDQRHLRRRQETGRHPDRTQPCGSLPLPHDRRHRHQRQPDGVRPRAAQPRLPRAGRRPQVQPQPAARNLSGPLPAALRPARTGRKEALSNAYRDGCSRLANSTPTGCPTARCFRPRSKACFPPAN